MAQIVVGLALFLAFDAAVFRSGLYSQWISPGSGLGTLMNILRATESAPDVRGGVLIFGNSRMAEGFSAKLANAEAERLGSSRRFFNSAVPGATPRVWYYMLRDYRDHGLRPAAVVFMADSLNDGPGLSDPNEVADIAFLGPLLGWRDIAGFPLSFPTAAGRLEALEAVLFKGWLFHADVADFLLSPLKRIKSAQQAREFSKQWIYDYPGHEESLTGLGVDPATGAIVWGPLANVAGPAHDYVAAIQRSILQKRGETPIPEAGRFTRDWFAAAAGLCRDMGAKLIVFRTPRGPLQSVLPPLGEPHGALADLAAAGDLQLLKPDTFDDLERPQYFFDQLHMNRTGRELFSPRLARETLRLLGS